MIVRGESGDLVVATGTLADAEAGVDMDLHFCSTIKSHQIQNHDLILKFSNASFKDNLIWSIKEDKLIRMHRDPEAVVLTVSAKLPEPVGKVFLPGNGADRMGCKGDKADVIRKNRKPCSVLYLRIFSRQDRFDSTVVLRRSSEFETSLNVFEGLHPIERLIQG